MSFSRFLPLVPAIVTGLFLGMGFSSVLQAADGPGGETYSAQGTASFYRSDYQGYTASGELYHPDLFTAAHATLPLGAWVRVTNPQNRRSVILRINDRSPFVAGNLINVSRAAADKLELVHAGYGKVVVSSVPSQAAASPRSGAAPAVRPPANPKEVLNRLIPVNAGSGKEALSARKPAAASAQRPNPLSSQASRGLSVGAPVHRVEFGTYRELRLADQAQDELRRMSVDSVIYRRNDTGPGEPTFRLVTTGGFSEEGAAQRWLDYIKGLSGNHFPDAIVSR